MSTGGVGFQIQFIGLVEAYVSMEAWAVELGPALEAAAQAFGDDVAAETADKVPVVTGTLAGSVKAQPTADGVSVTIGQDVPYAGWIEFGGSRGRPLIPTGRYLYPTALAAEPDWATLAAKTAIETVGSFPWPIPVF